MPGTGLSTSPGASRPSDCATGRIGPDQRDWVLDRYFREVEAILTAPDPQLELPDEERYVAAIHSKTLPISGLLLESLCDTLIKFAVRGPEVPSLAVNDISLRIDRLVRALLQGADRVR